MEELVTIALCFMLGLIIGYPIWVISKNINELEDEIKSLEQRIFELEDDIKSLKQRIFELEGEIKKLKE